MPYRVELRSASHHTLERLIELGALDVEEPEAGALVALMPDRISREQIARAVGVREISITPALGRDDGSVWVLSLPTIRVGNLRDLKLIDATAFGTGLHPTTALCLEALEETTQIDPPDAVLDVGTGSGVLALAALARGVPRALGIDIDDEALRVARENARLNQLDDRLQLMRGGPGDVTGTWPLVLANVLAAPLIEMAPTLVRRVGHHGRLVLSGIPSAVERDVDSAYRRLGMQRVGTTSRGGWVALIMQASW